MQALTIPDAWRALNVADWRGPILVLGASDSGKSTFARYLYQRLLTVYQRVAFLDADLGQSSFECPTTVGVALNADEDAAAFPPLGACRICFVGSNTPRGSELRLLTCLFQMWRFALQTQVDALVMDTSGFVDPKFGAAELKWAQVELFRPCTVVAIQKSQELSHILWPLQQMARVRVVTLPVCDAVRTRSRETRRAYRALCYRTLFEDARRVPLPYRRLAVFPDQCFLPGRIVALEDRYGFTLALALIERANDAVVWLRTPWSGEGRVSTLRLGALSVDPVTFQDTVLGRDFNESDGFTGTL